MNWRTVTFKEAMAHATARTVARVYEGSVVEAYFTDGTALRITSRWSGPYSEETPDIDRESPEFEIGEGT